jgi:AbiV family abortive infection protein
MAKPTQQLTRAQILQGYRLCLENADDLKLVCMPVAERSHAAALAIAQIAQEELGKSMLLLCAITFSEQAEWRDFWKRWRDHDLKAHMASWYEWIDPLRVGLVHDSGAVLDGIPIRSRFSAEKEAGLYVDYDENEEAFVAPSMQVSPQEAVSRLMAMGSLALTATSLFDVIMSGETDFRAEIMSRHMRLLWDGFRLQQDMNSVLRALSLQSEAHARFIEELDRTFQQNREMLRQIYGPARDDPEDQ